MKPDQISEALNLLPEDMVEEALLHREKGKKKPWYRLWGMGLAACLVLVTGLFLWDNRNSPPSELMDAEPYLATPTVFDKSSSEERGSETTSTLHEDDTILHTPTVNPNADIIPPTIFIHGGLLHTPTVNPEEDTQSEDVVVVPYPSKHLLFSPQYPKMTPYPGWTGDWDAERQWMEEKAAVYESVQDFELPEGFMKFYDKTARIFLTDRQGENATYSPLNLYLALSMLAEVTDGSTRQEILGLLGTETIEEVRENAAAFWLSNYCDDGILTCKLGNSIWLRDDMSYEEDTLATLAEIYYTASYKGTMGSEEYTQDLRNWINEHTGGLLQEQVEGLGFDERTVAALVSTLCFKAGWENAFRPENTDSRSFYGETETVTMDFLHRVCDDIIYFGENFTAVKLPMSDGTAMWFFLPDEGVTPHELLEQEAVYDLPIYEKWSDRRKMELSLYLPKFDITAKTDLVPGLMELGVTEAFSPVTSDFSSLTKDRADIYFSKAEHCTRVKIDEEGSEAAAYTILNLYAGAPAPEKFDQMELVFDRPFLFVITGRTDHPLFTGIVDQPR